ncbi:MAG: uroporphyrinogen-III C-methyltransferase [Actinomycetota bacterium]|nr:uroporphyrinogen-III C-methyltransferase [Actinomycetota bacterium]
MSKGTVYLIGAGPGDPGLITVKGRQHIREADVIVYDYLANPRLLGEAGPFAEKIYVGKRARDHTAEQDEINKLLVEKARQGKVVARLKGGDAFIFGRGGEEALYLAANGIPFEVVPGVSSAYAVPAYAGIPVTHRGLASDVAFITGHEQRAGGPGIAWEMLAKSMGTLVFLMGVKNLPDIVGQLTANGRPGATPVAVIRWGTLAGQETLTGTLDDIVAKVDIGDFRPPAVIVVGEVVRLREQLAWFEKKPLFGRRVLVTRAADQAGALAAGLESAGAEVVEFPTIDILPVDDSSLVDQAVAEMAGGQQFDWLIFTSANTVDFFFKRVAAAGRDARLLSGAKIAVVGSATAARLKSAGLTADLIPSDFRAEGLIEEFKRLSLDGTRILMPRAREAREILPEALRNMGAEVTVAPVYKNVPANPPVEEIKEALISGRIDFITFTSGSTVKNFAALIGPDGTLPETVGKAKVAAIGPVTAKAVEKAGLAVDLMPKDSTIPALIDEIVASGSEL